MKITEISYKDIKNKYLLESLFLGKFYPAIFKKEDKYGIRIKIGENINRVRRISNYDYFYTDKTGLIISSPRGLARQYNKKVRITDIEDGVKEYENKTV